MSTLGGSQLVNVRFAEAGPNTSLPVNWDSELLGFGSMVPDSALNQEPDVGDFYRSVRIPRLERKPFSIVADFDGDAGASRLVVPEVRIGAELFGFAVRWMLSPEAMGAVASVRARKGDGDGG